MHTHTHTYTHSHAIAIQMLSRDKTNKHYQRSSDKREMTLVLSEPGRHYAGDGTQCTEERSRDRYGGRKGKGSKGWRDIQRAPLLALAKTPKVMPTV